LRAALGGAAGLALGARAVAAAPAQAPGAAAAATERLADDLFLLRIPGQTNVLAHAGTNGVLLVDGVSAGASEALMQAVAGLPRGGTVHTIFNTHWHPEQTGSNELVGKAGQTIIAHENTRLWLGTDVTWPWDGRRFTRLPKIAQPNKTFYTAATLTVSPGTPDSQDVRYAHVPDAAHTDGDLYVYFPRQNVLAVGDIVSGDGWPVVDWTTGGWIGGIVGGIQRLSTVVNEETRIVASCGPVMSVADLKAQYGMYNALYERLTQLLNKGRGPTEAVEARPAREFEAQMGNADEFVRRAFESLWAYLSPDA
jgi:glyoxylase-like metal-dependent hydrolase (beta-lactamase superfamily II)